MAMALDTGGIGWKGYAKLSSSEVGSNKILPFNTCSLTENLEAIQNNGIHGGGVSELNGIFGSEHNVAIGKATYSGDMAGDVFAGTGQYALANRILFDHAIGRSSSDHTHRLMGFGTTYPIIFAPGGETAYQYPSDTVINRKTGSTVTLATPVKAVVSSFKLNGTNNANITYSASIMATSRKEVTGVKPIVSDFSFESVSNLDDDNPVPFWSASFNVVGSGEDFNGSGYALKDFITAWSIDVNNNTQPLWTFNGNNVASDMIQGRMEVTGSFSYYSPNGYFRESLNNGATLAVTLGSTVINIPYMFFTTAPIPNEGVNTIVARSVSFRALATSVGASIYLT